MYLKPCQQSCVYWWVVIVIHPENNLMMLTNLVFHFAYNCKDSPFFLLYKKFPSYLCTPVVRTSCKGPGGKHLVFLDCVVSVPTTDSALVRESSHRQYVSTWAGSVQLSTTGRLHVALVLGQTVKRSRLPCSVGGGRPLWSQRKELQCLKLAH